MPTESSVETVSDPEASGVAGPHGLEDPGVGRASTALLPTGPDAIAWAALAAPMVVWLAALWPAVMTNDSVDSLNQALGGQLVNWHPPVYTWMLGISMDLVGSPSLLAGVQVIMLAWAIRRLLGVAVDLGGPRWAVYGFGVLIACLPPVGAFAAHIWKDIPYAVGFLLICEWVIRSACARTSYGIAGPKIGSVVRLGLGLTAILILRSNGILVWLLLLLPILLTAEKPRKYVVAAVGASAVIFVVVTRILYPAVGVNGPPEVWRTTPAVLDLAAVAQHRPEDLDEPARSAMDELAPIAQYRRDYECHWAGSSFTRSLWNNSEVDLGALRDEWREELVQNPLLLAGNHVCAASSTWNPIPSDEELVSFETLHDQVVTNRHGVHSDPLVDGLGSRARDVLRTIEDGSARQILLWRAATWSWTLAILLVAAAIRRRSTWLLVPLIPIVAQGLSIVAIAGPHYRYNSPAWIGAVMMIPAAVVLIASVRKDIVDS